MGAARPLGQNELSIDCVPQSSWTKRVGGGGVKADAVNQSSCAFFARFLSASGQLGARSLSLSLRLFAYAQMLANEQRARRSNQVAGATSFVQRAHSNPGRKNSSTLALGCKILAPKRGAKRGLVFARRRAICPAGPRLVVVVVARPAQTASASSSSSNSDLCR